MSTPPTPSSVTAIRDNVTLAAIKKYKTEELADFLHKEDLGLDKRDLEIIQTRKIDGKAFLKMSKQDFRDSGFEIGPAIKLADFVNKCKRGPGGWGELRPFSSYLSLSEALADYGLGSNVDSIPLFSLPSYEIQDDNKFFKRCMEEILGRLCSYGTLYIDSLEAMRNEYVVALLHAAIHIVMDVTDKKLNMRPQYKITEDSRGWADYAIREVEELVCITEDKQHRVQAVGLAQNIKQLESAYEANKLLRKRKWDENDFDYLYGIVTTGSDWYFLLYSPGAIYKGSKVPYSITFTDDALDEKSEEYRILIKNVKEVLGIIVGLLMDRACAEKEPEKKKAKISEKLKNNYVQYVYII